MFNKIIFLVLIPMLIFSQSRKLWVDSLFAKNTTGTYVDALNANIAGQSVSIREYLECSIYNHIGPGSHTSYIFGGTDAFPDSIGSNSYLCSIMGGYDHKILDNAIASTISGGGHNTIYSGCTHTTISGGSFHSVDNSDYATISGGTNNDIDSCDYSVISGGANNSINSNNPTIGLSTIGGGGSNEIITAYRATISGGFLNTVSANYGTISGGTNNIVNGISSFIGGGGYNYVLGSYSSATSGFKDSVNAGYSFIGSGRNNKITTVAPYSFIGGGYNNSVAGQYSGILGGDSCQVGADWSFAIGRKAKTTLQGAYAFTDAQNSEFSVTNTNTFGARFANGYWLMGGNFGINKESPAAKLHVYNDVDQNILYLESVGGIDSSVIVNPSGNVGIGTNPAYKLHVNGMIRADSIYTTKSASWADYVFEDNYILNPFSKEINYIKRNKHLRSLSKSDTSDSISSAAIQRRLEGAVEEVEKLYLYVDNLYKYLKFVCTLLALNFIFTVFIYFKKIRIS